MSGREITVKAIEALKCIRAGMSDAALMEKFGLSASALHNLFSQLVAAGILLESEVHARGSLAPGSVILGMDKDAGFPELKKKPVVDAAQALRCIRYGLDDATLMRRFDITAKGLQSLFKKLLTAGVISQADLDKRAPASRPDVPVLDEPQGDRIGNQRSGSDHASLTEKDGVPEDEVHPNLEQLMDSSILDASDLDDRGPTVHPSILLRNRSASLPPERQRKPVIDAADALHSLRAGLDDAALMKKYDISARGLQSLFAKLVAAGAVTYEELEERLAKSSSDVILDEGGPEAGPAPEGSESPDLTKVVDDVRSAVSHETMMERFNLSSKELNELLKRLVTQGMISQAELDRSLSQNSTRLEIRHRATGQVIYRGMERSLGALVEKAVRELVNLADADLAGANLSRRDLSGAQMARADIRKGIMVGTDMTGADLSGAMLKSTDLYAAILHKANLASADLSDSNMTRVNALWAFMPNINLAEANLSNANLMGANLAGANLFESILNGTRLDGAYLVGAQLDYVRKGED
jgi:uncharacterized protein YjbI with pentapeptide repeats